MDQQENTFGTRLRAEREAAGFSQAELARRTRPPGGLALTSSYINKLENGDIKRPSYETVEALANALGIVPERLTGQRIRATRPMNSVEGAVLDLVRALQVDDPLAFLRDVASLHPLDQELLAGMARSMAKDAHKRARRYREPQSDNPNIIPHRGRDLPGRADLEAAVEEAKRTGQVYYRRKPPIDD